MNLMFPQMLWKHSGKKILTTATSPTFFLLQSARIQRKISARGTCLLLLPFRGRVHI